MGREWNRAVGKDREGGSRRKKTSSSTRGTPPFTLPACDGGGEEQSGAERGVRGGARAYPRALRVSDSESIAYVQGKALTGKAAPSARWGKESQNGVLATTLKLVAGRHKAAPARHGHTERQRM